MTSAAVRQVAPAPRRRPGCRRPLGLVHRPGVRSARPAGPGHRQEPADPAGRRLGSARRDRRPRRSTMDHRRRPERDRAGRPRTGKVDRYPLPPGRDSANLNTAAFRGGVLWFTGQAGVLGRLDPKAGRVEVFDAPRGPGPYGITTTPIGQLFYASLAGSHIGRIDHRTGAAEVLEPPTRDQGARRVWSDSRGRIWVSEWNTGQLGRYDPADGRWRERKLPGANPMAYAVYVDDNDHPWLSDFAANALVRFDPRPGGSPSSPCRARRPTCANCLAGPARCGAPSPAWTSSWWSAPARPAATAASWPPWPSEQALGWWRSRPSRPGRAPPFRPTALCTGGDAAGMPAGGDLPEEGDRHGREVRPGASATGGRGAGA